MIIAVLMLLTFWQQRAHLNSVPVLQRPHRRAQVQKRDWAHVIDVNRPMKNFHQLVPDMAHKVSRRFDTPPPSFTSRITLTLTCCAYTLVSL